MKLELTRAEIELRLERGMTGKMIQFETIDNKPVVGKLQRIAVEAVNGELMVAFQVDRLRYEFDLYYFTDHITILYGNTSSAGNRDVRGILRDG
jgi:hypothetical protein